MNEELAWVPQACTLPRVEQPLRVAEFDDLFATALREVNRLTRTRLRLVLDPTAEQAVRELTEREAECCSFFTFTIAAADDGVHVDVEVPDAEVAVLNALAERADATRGAAS